MAERQHEFLWEEELLRGKDVLWCDAKHRERIQAVDGVLTMSLLPSGPCYTMSFDPRYNQGEVKAEIERIIMEGEKT